MNCLNRAVQEKSRPSVIGNDMIIVNHRKTTKSSLSPPINKTCRLIFGKDMTQGKRISGGHSGIAVPIQDKYITDFLSIISIFNIDYGKKRKKKKRTKLKSKANGCPQPTN